MNTQLAAIECRELVCSYGKREAVNGLNLTIQPGQCYGFFGRNGAGKTTTIKCLLNLLRPRSGEVRVFGRNPQRDEVWVKERLCYVPDAVAFYPWMTVAESLRFLASFRPRWNTEIERDLISRFRLDGKQKTTTLSKGQRTQLALIGAVCPEPELLVLDEPTSGLDPIVRREFIQTVIGAYHAGGNGDRTIFVSTHLISEFEGLIDAFTIIDQGREVLTMTADEARNRYRRIRASFSSPVTELKVPGAISVKQTDRDVEVLANGDSDAVLEQLRGMKPTDLKSEALSLEDIFVASEAIKGSMR